MQLSLSRLSPIKARSFPTSEVEQAVEQKKVCIVNALSPELYAGTGDFYYQRRGHIPSSLLLHFDNVLDNEYFLPAEQLSRGTNKVRYVASTAG